MHDGVQIIQDQGHPVSGYLRPGELMFFHGMTAAQRGTCLVVSVLPHITPQGVYSRPEITVLTRQMKLYTFLDEDPDGVFWTRLSERDTCELE